MEIDDTKEFLRGYAESKTKTDRIKFDIYDLRSYRASVTRIISGSPSKSNRSDISMIISRIEHTEKQYIELLQKEIEKRERITAAIDMLTDETQKALLQYRYINMMQWEKICQMIGYEYAQVHRIHKKALEQLTEELTKNGY